MIKLHPKDCLAAAQDLRNLSGTAFSGEPSWHSKDVFHVFLSHHCPFTTCQVPSKNIVPIFPSLSAFPEPDPRHGLLHGFIAVALAVFQQTKSLNNGRLLHFKWYLPFARIQRGETCKGHAHHEAHIVTWGGGDEMV